MSDVAAAIQTAIEIVGQLRKLSKKVEDAEFKMLLADLSGELADAKLEVADLKMQLAKTKEQLRLQTELLEHQETEKPTLCEGAYQFPDDPGFFCTACFDTKKQRVRVSVLPGPFSDFGKWQCPSCNAILS
jgi:hypothetical protein